VYAVSAARRYAYVVVLLCKHTALECCLLLPEPARTNCLQDFVFKLSDDLLAKLLSYVQLQQRIGSCSLVCRAWRGAAAAATPDISITLQLQDTSTQLDERCSCLESWLRNSSHPVNCLTLTCTDCDGWPGGFWYPNDAPEAPHLHLP
jgi:hypothetical protein